MTILLSTIGLTIVNLIVNLGAVVDDACPF